MSRASFIVPPATRANQALAADPEGSAWVSANAGSGKTKVLVDRVLRLLLQGVEPGRILCLTYTTATAANMSNKVFERLGGWTGMSEEALETVLEELVSDPSSSRKSVVPLEQKVRARRLFAQALETPGGLKIETIHAFCTRVLQMAPFEANVPARFEVMDDTQCETLLQTARREVMSAALLAPGSDLGRALQRLSADTANDDGFARIVQAALKVRARFCDANDVPYPTSTMRERLAQALDITPDLTAREVAQDFRTTVDRLVDVDHVIATYAKGSVTDIRIADAARGAVKADDPRDALEHWIGALLTAQGEIRKSLGTAAVAKLDPELPEQLVLLANHVIAATDRLRAIETLERTAALATLVTAIFARFDAAKQRRRLLDYSDLITKTRSLLTRVGSSWVLYKLDAGIDHVLVDEAQDTTPEQWDILQSLTSEFTAGAGARPSSVTRTMFAVGDQKQSIYGFQGAAPELFEDMRRAFGGRTTRAEARFSDIRLNTSFRSTPDVIAAVDAIFGLRQHWDGLTFEENVPPQRHDTARPNDAGAVDLWPIAADDPEPERTAWNIPLDAPERQHHTIKLARRIATQIARWMAAKKDDLGQPFAPGDVLILVSKRGPLFEAIVKALKDNHVPVAGRDRLRLAVHPAVEDLLILGQAVLLPDDDLALATTLRTPLFDLDDADLMAFAPTRAGSLREALREAAVGDARLAAAQERLEAFVACAHRKGPFGFFAHVLGAAGGRHAAIRRLGAEAGDAVDSFLSEALDYERRHGLSIYGFLRSMAGSSREVKRDLSAPGRDVRVMTVHGAKGLEARIVILADVGRPQGGSFTPRLLDLPLSGRTTDRGAIADPVPVWSPIAKTDPASVIKAKTNEQTKVREERNRLLYVALTRAEDRLIICGAGKTDAPPAGSWYETIERGLSLAIPGLVEIPAPDGQGTIRRFKITPAPPVEASALAEPGAPSPASVPPPEWLYRHPPAEAPPPPPLAPSHPFVAADQPDRPLDEGLVAAAAEGRLAHLLLQVLPGVSRDRRKTTAMAIASARAAALTPQVHAAIVDSVMAVLDQPDLAALFGPGSLAEVPVSGAIDLPDGTRRQVQGRIDRLLITDTEIIVADFKTGARPPTSARSLFPRTLVQMAIYDALAASIFPERMVRARLIFTADRSVIEPSRAQLLEALTLLAADAGTPAR
jgi:ATP-dependent helicase/nuclease subunit A